MSQADQWATIQARQAASLDAAARRGGAAPQPQTPPGDFWPISQSLGVGVGHARAAAVAAPGRSLGERRRDGDCRRLVRRRARPDRETHQ